ncbi:MAG: hypothetical protein AAGF11_12090 [Myxococcota bacterium]
MNLVVCGCSRQISDPPAELDVAWLCQVSCERLFDEECVGDIDPVQEFGAADEQECRSSCEASGPWNGRCRVKFSEIYECQNELSCSEFERYLRTSGESSCADESTAWSACRVGGPG